MKTRSNENTLFASWTSQSSLLFFVFFLFPFEIKVISRNSHLQSQIQKKTSVISTYWFGARITAASSLSKLNILSQAYAIVKYVTVSFHSLLIFISLITGKCMILLFFGLGQGNFHFLRVELTMPVWFLMKLLSGVASLQLIVLILWLMDIVN